MLKQVKETQAYGKQGLSAKRRLWCAVQRLLPQFFLTKLAARIAKIRWRPFNRLFIAVFIKLFSVDLSEAKRNSISDYEDFDDFFTRSLRPGIRPLAGAGHLCCPVDGAVSEAGSLEGDSILQFKGMYYNLPELFAGYADLAAPFVGGNFLCLYLAPCDYHRVHAPVNCDMDVLLHVPGRLFGVGHASVRWVPRLFSRNERVLMLFDSKYGRVAVIMVGACMVGSIETAWTGRLAIDPSEVSYVRPETGKANCKAGDCIGRFHYGSTVIVLTEPGRLSLADGLITDSKVRMGQSLGHISR